MASKKEISEFLKENNLTKNKITSMWEELIPINKTIEKLNNAFKSWEDLPIHLIKSIPTQKEKDLIRIENEKIEEENQRILQEKIAIAKENELPFEQKMLQKIDNNECLTEEELENVIGEYAFESNDIEEYRWAMYTQSILRICGRTFAINWQRGLTEYQCNHYSEQPHEVKQITKTIVVNEWEAVNGK